MKKQLLKSMLLLCALIVGGGKFCLGRFNTCVHIIYT